MVDVWLPYGKTEVCARIPTRNFLGEVRPDFPEKVTTDTEITRALREPFGTVSLNNVVKDKKRIAIAFYGYIPPPLLNSTVSILFKELIDEAFRREVNLILSHDSEVPLDTLDVEALSRQNNDLKISIIKHDIASKNGTYIGKTSSGNKLYLNKIFAEADVRVTVSTIGLHPFAGFSGGRMTVLPGVAMEKSIQRCYSLLANPKAYPGNLMGNPVHKEMTEAATLADVAFTLNLVMNQRGELLKAFSGDVEESFISAVEFTKECSSTAVKEDADIIIVSPGGNPHDSNLFRALDSLIFCEEVLKKEGNFILAAECSEGYGNEVFVEWFRKFRDTKRLENAIRKRYAYGAHQAYSLAKILEKTEVTLVSALPDYYTNNIFGVNTAKAVNYALNSVLNKVKTKARVLVVPLGNFTLLKSK